MASSYFGTRVRQAGAALKMRGKRKVTNELRKYRCAFLSMP